MRNERELTTVSGAIGYGGTLRGRTPTHERASIVGGCLTLAVASAVTIAVFRPDRADASQRNHERESMSCHSSYESDEEGSGGGRCIRKTRCNEATTTTTEAPTTSTLAVDNTTTAPPTTTDLVATTTTAGASTSTTSAPSTTLAETTTTEDSFEGGTIPTTTGVPTSFVVAGSTAAAPTTSRPLSALAVDTTAPVAPAAASLPRTGSDPAFPAIFGVGCVAAGLLLLLRRRGAEPL